MIRRYLVMLLMKAKQKMLKNKKEEKRKGKEGIKKIWTYLLKPKNKPVKQQDPLPSIDSGTLLI